MTFMKSAPILLYSTTVNYSDTSPKTLFNIKSDIIILDVWVKVNTAFDGAAPTIEIGDASDADGLIPSSSVDLKTTGYQALSENSKGAYLWDGTNKKLKVYTADTDIQATFNSDGSTTGQVKIYFLVADARYI